MIPQKPVVRLGLLTNSTDVFSPAAKDRTEAATRRLVEKLLQGYCDRICPPSARHTVLLGFDVGLDRATILEIQRIFGLPGTGRPVELAQFRSPRGRCDDSDLRYCQVLGVAEPANSLASTPAVRRLTSAST